MLGVASFAVVGLVGSWSLTASKASAPPSPSAGRNVESPRPVLPCVVNGEGRKLSDSVDLSVPLLVSGTNAFDGPRATTTSERISVGFASSPTDAVGLTLDPVTLDAAQAFAESQPTKLSSVTPTPSQAGTSFTTGRLDKGALSRTLLALGGKGALLTTTKGGLTVAREGITTVPWPELAGAEMTAPRAENLPDGRAVLVLRRGGRTGDILVGLLTAEGRAAAPLTRIATEAYELGTPALTASDRELLVTFATRKTPSSPWRVELARAPLGQLPATSRPFALSGLSEELGMLSPAAVATERGGWLLQWTEGSGKKYRVRLQTLDAELEPVGAPLDVGTPDQSAGQGAPWVGPSQNTMSGAEAARGVSLYVVRSSRGSELWATALRCP